MQKVFILLILCIFISGCATTKPTKVLQKVSLGSSKEEVIKKMGEPTVVRGAIKNKYNEIVEVWEYRLAKVKTGEQLGKELSFAVFTLGLGTPVLLSEGEIQNYWLYFVDNELVRWGQSGDWEREADRIYDIRFKSGERLTQ